MHPIDEFGRPLAGILLTTWAAWVTWIIYTERRRRQDTIARRARAHDALRRMNADGRP